MGPKKEEERPKTTLLGRLGTNLQMGIVGLPNVGKSSFFNLLTKQQVPAENFPFCTINPNKARVVVPDVRFDLLCKIFKPASEVPGSLGVTDIAGLVQGAAQGEGLGNAFLSNINAVDGIFHMIRIFEDKDITHVEGDVDPIRDIEIIMEELIAKDLEYIQNIIHRLNPIVERGIDKTKESELIIAKQIEIYLQQKIQLRCATWNSKEIEYLNTLTLLTTKATIFLCNMSKADFLRKKNKWLVKIKEWIDAHTGEKMIPFSLEYEQEIEPEMEVQESLKQTSMLAKIITEGFHCLRLVFFFTAGEDEVRAWVIQKGMKAPKASGRIHGDMEHGFIRADVIGWQDFEELKSLADCKENGKMRQEGKNYEVQDGDILNIRFNPPAKGNTAKK